MLATNFILFSSDPETFFKVFFQQRFTDKVDTALRMIEFFNLFFLNLDFFNMEFCLTNFPFKILILVLNNLYTYTKIHYMVIEIINNNFSTANSILIITLLCPKIFNSRHHCYWIQYEVHEKWQRFDMMFCFLFHSSTVRL